MTAAATTGQHANQGRLSRGRNRAILIRELALGAAPKTALAKRFGVTDAAIRLFEARWEAEIDAARGDLESEWVGLWIADKYNRIAELQQIAEDVGEQLTDIAGRLEGFDNQIGVPLLKIYKDILRQVAEELGQLPKSTSEAFIPVPPTIVYNYPGVDPTKLG